MKLVSASLLLTLLYQVNAQGPTVAGYNFVNDYTISYLRADSDVKQLSAYVDKGTQPFFDAAKDLYLTGAFFRPQVIVSIDGSGLSVNLASREVLSGRNSSNAVVNLASSTSYVIGTKNVTFNYLKPECIYGGLLPADRITIGCLSPSGNVVTEAATVIPYTVSLGNVPGRSMQAFVGTNTTMRGIDGEFYPDFQTFYDYYGKIDYADIYIQAALNGAPTSFSNGNVDFTGKALIGRNQAVKKGAAYMLYYMQAVRYFYSAQETCSLSLFEEGVALYIGGLEGPSGTNGNGYMPYTLADKRCPNFKTCGPNGNELVGKGSINFKILELFNDFKAKYNSSTCTSVSPTLLPIIKNITGLMKVPMIQGTLRYSDEVANAASPSYALRAEAAVFAAGVLPYVHKCNKDSAVSILTQITTGTGESVFLTVKAELEKNYKCMGVKCADVGGIVDGLGNYRNTTNPCVDTVPKRTCKKKRSRCKANKNCCSKQCGGIFFKRCR